MRQYNFAQIVHTDGVAISVMFLRPKPAAPPAELPRMGRGVDAVNPLAHLHAEWLGVDPGKTNMATVAHEERSAAGTVVSVRHWKLTAGQYYRDSGITRQAQATKTWLAKVKPQLTALSRVSSKPSSLASYRRFANTVLATYDAMWAEVSKKRWANAKFRLYCGKMRVVASFWAKVKKQAQKRWPDRILALAYGAASFSGSGSIGCRGVPVRARPDWPVNAMVTKKRGVMARCAGAQKAREVVAQRRAAEAEAKAQAGAAEAETQAQADAGAYEADEAGADEAGAYEADAGAYEAEAQAQADARAYEAQLHQLQPELQQREQQATDTRRLQHLQQQLQDLQQDELQRKEQQVAEQQQQLQQQQADMHLREQQLAEQQHQLQQQQADMHLREQQVAQQQQQVQQQQADLQVREQQVAQQHHQVQQQQADLQLREQQVAQQKHQVQQQQADLQVREQQVAQQHYQVQLQQQLNRLQQQLEAQSGAELQRQVQQQLAAQQHLLQQQQADLLLKQQQLEAQRGHIMRRRYLVLDDARQAGVCSMPEADVERMHDKVEGCRAMHRMVFTPDREQPQWAMAACACSTCMNVPCLPCMKPDTTTPLEPMPMFQDTVKEVYDDEECYALLMWFYPDLLHDEVCFGKLTNTHCARYCQHMGLDRPKERRKLRRLVVRDLRSEQLEFEYEVHISPSSPLASRWWLRPVYSEAKRSQVRGLMSSTSYNIRFYDRDVSAALNIRRCAVGPGPRPTELCYWDGRPAMPKPGRPGQEWVYLRDKAMLRKWRRKWRR
ncbi:hypothetical protein QJQ45_003134 [Haematococcus lacustris]|nr:hypothetical protein QJQ45_003134 [Haematococcus lacustris]